MPVPVEYDTRVNEQVVTCLSKSCVWYKSFKVCCHTVAITNKLNVLSTLISKLNAKSTTEQALINFASVSRDKNCRKKEKATQKRKGPSSNKPQKIARLLPFPDRGALELSQPPSTSQRYGNTVSATPDLQQSFHFPNTFLQLPPSQNPVTDFSTPARDLKDSLQEVVCHCHSIAIKMFQFVMAVQDASEKMVIPYLRIIWLWCQKHRDITWIQRHIKK